jgi:hypothetical protein
VNRFASIAAKQFRVIYLVMFMFAIVGVAKHAACARGIVMTQSRFDEDKVFVFSPSQEGLSFIEQLHAVSQISCEKKGRPYLTGVSVELEKIALLKPYCKTWSCPYCAARNARRWIARIIHGCNCMDTKDGWFMFTLTAHRKWRRRDKSVKNLRQGWKKLYNRIRRMFGTNHYVKVWEQHKDGSFHLHGLVDAQISKKWLKQSAVECGMGYQVDIHKVDNAGQVAGYIAKYFMKSEFESGQEFPKNLRRIEVSRSWIKLPDLRADTDWVWVINQTREGQLRNAFHLKSTYQFDVIDNVKE